MRKALFPMIASLALCGAATAALVATNARAEQGGRKPVMIALVTPDRNSTGAQFTTSEIDFPLARLVHQSSALRGHVTAPVQNI